MALYKLAQPLNGTVGAVFKQRDSKLKISIPFHPDNKDYQEYLEWVAEGNTADAAD